LATNGRYLLHVNRLLNLYPRQGKLQLAVHDCTLPVGEPLVFHWVEAIFIRPKLDFPLTLMPCDSGRDNQLRVKSPPMIVSINKKTQTKNNKFRGDDETHHGRVECTDA
jgi:hypothetical protein